LNHRRAGARVRLLQYRQSTKDASRSTKSFGMVDISEGLQAVERREPAPWPQGVELAAFCFCVANVVAAICFFAAWLLGVEGFQTATDFVAFWPAGRFVLDGQAAAVYDQVAHKAAAVAALGYGFEGNFPMRYPPPYLLLLSLFALLPYTASYLAWVVLSALLYIFVISRIVGHRSGILLACAFPVLLANAVIGQNGCITAALFGGALLAMERRPVLAGCLFALLTYKPQFGILIPLALICAGQWRVFMSAAVGAVALALLSWMILGTGAWEGFMDAILRANQYTLGEGRSDWGKLQNLFGLVRVMGGSLELAWIVHGMAIAVTAVWVCVAWSGRQPFAIKAAILSVGAVICAPYIHMYDVVLLAVPVAYLLRDGRDRGFLPGEMPGLGVACLLLASFPFVKLPVGVGAVLIVAGLIARRYFVADLKASAPQAPFSQLVPSGQSR
jgi:arabinofuranan 3-O-arabinosyltransferase